MGEYSVLTECLVEAETVKEAIDLLEKYLQILRVGCVGLKSVSILEAKPMNFSAWVITTEAEEAAEA